MCVCVCASPLLSFPYSGTHPPHAANVVQHLLARTQMHTERPLYKYEIITYIVLRGFSHLVTHTENPSESAGRNSVAFFLIAILFFGVNEAHHVQLFLY